MVLDSGSTLTLLDAGIGKVVNAAIGGYIDPNLQAMFVDCSLRNEITSFEFTFGTKTNPKVTIRVPISEMILPSPFTSGQFPPWLVGIVPTNACLFGLRFSDQVPPQTTNILGDSFLRSAYVVYDLENNLVGIAQTKFGSNTTNIVEFQKNATSFPMVPGDPMPSDLFPAPVLPASQAVAPKPVSTQGVRTSARVTPAPKTSARVSPRPTTSARIRPTTTKT